jgi:hypothetical protein
MEKAISILLPPYNRDGLSASCLNSSLGQPCTGALTYFTNIITLHYHPLWLLYKFPEMREG